MGLCEKVALFRWNNVKTGNVCDMNRHLKEIGAIPVTTSVIESLYPEPKSADKKVVWLEKKGYIIRMKLKDGQIITHRNFIR